MNFNPIEIILLAQKLEENGMAFYQRASRFTKDENAQETLLKLSKMEEEHLRMFKKLEKEMDMAGFTDSAEVQIYLSRTFSPDIFKSDPAARIGKDLSGMKEIYQFALRAEVESVEFYQLIRTAVTNPETIRTLDRIISDENAHARLMQDNIDAMDRK